MSHTYERLERLHDHENEPRFNFDEVNAIRGDEFYAEEISPAEFEDLWKSSG